MGSTFTAPCLFDGGCDAACFNAWVEFYLCPRLSETDVVVFDNAKIHKTRRTRELIEASGAEVLFLPPYSPDYNPIEHDFANIKRLREYNADISILKFGQFFRHRTPLEGKRLPTINNYRHIAPKSTV